MKLPEISWKSTRKYLSVASDILPKLPHLGDGPFTMFVKLLAIVDSFDKKLGSDHALYEFFTKLGDVEAKTNAQFVDLFFSTPLMQSFEIKKIAIGEYIDIIIASDKELGTLYLVEYHWGSKPEPSKDFWHSKGFDFASALKRLWSLFDNGIHINLKTDFRERLTEYRPIIFTKDPIVGPATIRLNSLITRHRKFVEKGFSRTYLFLGKQGAGKSTFATRMAQACGTRTLRIDSKGMTSSGANDLHFILSGLEPDFLILDDIDRVADTASAVPVLLEMLSDLKERHSHVTAILTANSIAPFDPAVLRPGRIDRVIQFPEADADERRLLLVGYLLEFKASCEKLDPFVEVTEGLTAAYIREIAAQLTTTDEAEVLENIKEMKALVEKAAAEKAATAPAATDTKGPAPVAKAVA